MRAGHDIQAAPPAPTASPGQHVVRIEFSDEFLLSVGRRQFAGRFGRGIAMGLGVCVAGWIFARLVGSEALQGGFIGVGAVFAFLWLVAWSRPKSALQHFQGVADRTVTYTFDDEGYTVASAFGAGRYHWLFIRKVERWPDYWLLHQRDGRTLFLPAGQADPDLVDLLRTRVG